MVRIARSTVILALLLIVVPAFAQEDEDVVDAVAELAAALRKADAEEFAKLASLDEPDPWLVADRLLRAGESGLALRFATAKARPATRGLAAYLLTEPQPSDAVEQAITLAQVRLEDDRATKPQLEGAIRALSSVLEGATPMEQARIHSLLGLTYAYAGDVAASSRELANAAAVAGKIGWVREGADAMGTASENARVLVQYDEAIQLARRELESRQQLGDEARLVAHLQRLAQLHNENGDLDAAVRELEDWSGKLGPEAKTEIALARANLNLQRVELEDALNVLRSDARPQNADQTGRVLMLLGDILRQRGDEAEALECYSGAAVELGKTKNPILIGRALGNTGISFVRLGKPGKARPHLDNAQRQFDEAGDRNLVALAVLFRGDAHAAAGEHAIALPLFDSVRTFASRTSDAWLEANALLRRGRALLATGHAEEARRAFAASHELGRRLRAPELEAEGAVGEAQCLLRQGHAARAEEAVDRAHSGLAPLVDGQAVPPGDEARRIFDLISAARVEAALLSDSESDLWRAIERARLGHQIRSAREGRLVRRSAMTEKMRRAETTARRTIQRATLFEARARDEEDRVAAVKWKAQREQAERELDSLYDAVVRAARPGWERLVPSPVTLHSLRERLGPSEVLVSYALSNGPAAAMVVTRADVRVVRLADSGAIRTSGAGDWGRLLIDPLKLRDGKTRVILIAPPELDKVLGSVSDRTRQYVRMPSATEFDRLRARRPGTPGARVYVAPAPSVQSIEEGPAPADLVILTEPIDGPALPRAFFLRGSSFVVAPRKPVDAVTAAAVASSWDPAKHPGDNWVVWGR